VFGAPFTSAEDTDDAVQAATSMLRRLSTFNAERKAMSRPIIQIGIGIDTGPVVAGTIGSPRRMDYTVIGQHVNLAARIESVNKQYGTRILISEDTRHRLTSDWSIREIDQVLVPGLEAPVRLYEVLDYHTDETFPNLERVLTAYEDGLSCYRNRHWREAAKIFGHALNLNPNDRPTQIFLSRCWAFIARPPGRNWTGITDLSI